MGNSFYDAALGIDNAVLTAFSPTNTDIADWRSRGGDQIRQESQAALAGQ